MVLKYLIEKEFKQMMRNRFLPRMIFVFPLVVLLLIPLAANFEIKNIRLCVVDNDNSPFSRSLVRKVSASGYFILSERTDSYSEALQFIELDLADIILEIPPDFEKNLVREQCEKLMISANSVNGTKGVLGSAYLAAIIKGFDQEIKQSGVWPSGAAAGPPGLEIIPRYWYNPLLDYPVFMVPALMVMLLAMLCGFLPALNIVGEKETGTIEQINVTPISKLSFILSKLIPYWIIGFVVLTICFGVARCFWGLIPEGRLFTIYLFASVFVLAISGFGLVISNYANSIQQAMFMMFFFVITFVLMSGLYTPVNSMPDWAQLLSRLSPLRYFIQVMRQVYLKGSGFGDLVTPFLALAGFAIFFNGWAVLSYRKTS
ncbi:MAG: ABC transporter permease [Bacteroidales bacterium]